MYNSVFAHKKSFYRTYALEKVLHKLYSSKADESLQNKGATEKDNTRIIAVTSQDIVAIGHIIINPVIGECTRLRL